MILSSMNLHFTLCRILIYKSMPIDVKTTPTIGKPNSFVLSMSFNFNVFLFYSSKSHVSRFSTSH